MAYLACRHPPAGTARDGLYGRKTGGGVSDGFNLVSAKGPPTAECTQVKLGLRDPLWRPNISR